MICSAVSERIPPLLIDTGASGTPPPERSSGAGVLDGPAGEVFARWWRQDMAYHLDLPGLARFRWDREGGPVHAMPDPAVPGETVRDAYRSDVLPLVLHVQGTEVLHASAVLTAAGVLALCGETGAGKSTIAYALHRQGHALWADDMLAVDVGQRPVAALPLPVDVRLRRPSAAFFGLPASPAPLRDLGPAPSARAPLAALCVLDRDPEAGAPVRVERLGPAAAFTALLPHAYCWSLDDAGRKRTMVERYLELAGRVPVFSVRFTPGFERLPDVLAALRALGSAAGAGPAR
jgi:hypothetical protein